MDIYMNSQLRDFAGLENLTEVQFTPGISENDGLPPDGFDSLRRIGDGLRLERNNQLQVLDGFPQLESLVSS